MGSKTGVSEYTEYSEYVLFRIYRIYHIKIVFIFSQKHVPTRILIKNLITSLEVRALVDINNDGKFDIYISATLNIDTNKRKNILYINHLSLFSSNFIIINNLSL